jgi:addiction module HigA family antidote
MATTFTLPSGAARHPGATLRHHIPSRMSLAEAARRLGISRPALYALLDGRAGVSPRMALRLAAATPVPAEMWLIEQARYDLARVKKNPPRGVRRLG